MIKPASSKKNSTASSKNSKKVAIISDIHFNYHDIPSWRAFCKWYEDVKPDKIVILGDFLDLGMLSRYSQGDDEEVYVVEQIKCFIEEVNPLTKYSEVWVVEGNHDDRWERVLKSRQFVFKGTKGLSLKDQCYAQGLDKSIKWAREDVKIRGLECGPFLLRHGHNQSGPFGASKNVAANQLDKTLGDNQVFGHFHKAQMYCKTAGGKTAVSIANPCLVTDQGYNVDPNWQRGFTVLELYGPNNVYATPYLVLIDGGHFAYNGKVYDGNK